MFVEKKLENVEMSVEKIFFTFAPSSVTWESHDANQNPPPRLFQPPSMRHKRGSDL